MYHKALDLQKHDRFEESAKAYHELLEARLLREVRHHRPGSGLALCPPLLSWATLDMLLPLCPSAFPPAECQPCWIAVRVEGI